MDTSGRKQEILDEYYSAVPDDPGFYQCRYCKKKIYAGEVRSDDLWRHELQCDR